jgi:hypothetical protein
MALGHPGGCERRRASTLTGMAPRSGAIFNPNSEDGHHEGHEGHEGHEVSAGWNASLIQNKVNPAAHGVVRTLRGISSSSWFELLKCHSIVHSSTWTLDIGHWLFSPKIFNVQHPTSNIQFPSEDKDFRTPLKRQNVPNHFPERSGILKRAAHGGRGNFGFWIGRWRCAVRLLTLLLFNSTFKI